MENRLSLSGRGNKHLITEKMQLQLLEGTFTNEEALDIINQMLQVKIKFHENKIEKSHNEEDIKMRERSIKQLQQDFYEARQAILSKGKNCQLEAEIKIN